MTGLQSPWGRRGAICEHFGWSWDYLHHGIAWSTVRRIMSDLPSYNDKKAKKNKDEFSLNEENADQIINYINSCK